MPSTIAVAAPVTMAMEMAVAWWLTKSCVECMPYRVPSAPVFLLSRRKSAVTAAVTPPNSSEMSAMTVLPLTWMASW